MDPLLTWAILSTAFTVIAQPVVKRVLLKVGRILNEPEPEALTTTLSHVPNQPLPEVNER